MTAPPKPTRSASEAHVAFWRKGDVPAGGARPGRHDTSTKILGGRQSAKEVGQVIEYDFSNLPGDVALVLSQQQHTRDLADDLGRVMQLGADGRELIHQELVGTVAGVVDQYLAKRRPSAT